MKEIRIHARAGQGAITTATLLGQAYFSRGKFAYAFPHFGAARMGAPMNAFVRVDDKPIRLRSQIYEPDYVIVVDATLMRVFDVCKGLKENGIIIVNEKEDIALPKVKEGQKVFMVPANKIAEEVMKRPLGNTVLLGAYACVTNEISLEDLENACKVRFQGKVQELNIEAIKRGFEYLK